MADLLNLDDDDEYSDDSGDSESPELNNKDVVGKLVVTHSCSSEPSIQIASPPTSQV